MINDPSVDNPMYMWIELRMEFGRLCREAELNMDLIKRIWSYCKFCLSHLSGDVVTAAVYGFCEHLIDSEEAAEVLPQLMTRTDFLEFKEILLYHNDGDKFNHYMNRLWPV